jgi:hypothetical protein
LKEEATIIVISSILIALKKESASEAAAIHIDPEAAC